MPQAPHAALPAASPHLLPARTCKRTSPTGQEPEKDTRCPASTTTQGQAGSCQLPLSGNTAHKAQTHGVLPAAPFSLANLGGPSSLGLQAVPSWGRRETENGCYVAAACCNTTLPASHMGSQLFRNQASCFVMESDGVFLYPARHRNSNQVTPR